MLNAQTALHIWPRERQVLGQPCYLELKADCLFVNKHLPKRVFFTSLNPTPPPPHEMRTTGLS